MNTIKLKKRIDINAMWNLVMEGKFQMCISRPELIGNPHVNQIIEQVLNIYKNEFSKDHDWDIREFYAEDHRDIMSFVKNVLRQISKDVFDNIENKEQYILDIVYPYKIKKDTIKSLLEEKEKQVLCDNCFEHRIYAQYVKKDLKPEDDIVCYDMVISGKVNEDSIKEIKIDIDRYLD